MNRRKTFRLRIRMGSDEVAVKDRPVGVYAFSTEQDREAALSLLAAFDGWLGYEILYPKAVPPPPLSKQAIAELAHGLMAARVQPAVGAVAS